MFHSYGFFNFAYVFQATATIKSLEAHSQYMDEQYNMLKRRRTDLLTQRERIFGRKYLYKSPLHTQLFICLFLKNRITDGSSANFQQFDGFTFDSYPTSDSDGDIEKKPIYQNGALTETGF